MVDEDRAVAQVPVEHDESVLADGLLRRKVRQVLVQVESERGRPRSTYDSGTDVG